MKKLLIFIFMSFVAHKTALAFDNKENKVIFGKDAVKIIEKGKILEVNINDDGLSFLTDYRVHVIYKGLVHICWVHTGADFNKGFTSKTKCEELIDVEWED